METYKYFVIKSNYFRGLLLYYEPIDQFLSCYQNLPLDHSKWINFPSANVMDISLCEKVSDVVGYFVHEDIASYTILLKKFDIEDRHEDLCQGIEKCLESIKNSSRTPREDEMEAELCNLLKEIVDRELAGRKDLENSCLLKLIECEFRERGGRPFRNKKTTERFKNFIKHEKENAELARWIEEKEEEVRDKIGF